MSFQPWLDPSNRPSALGNRMEITVPPGHLPPTASPVANRSVKIYPALPLRLHEERSRNQPIHSSSHDTSASSPGGPLPTGPSLSGRPNAALSPNSPHSPAPSMNNSSKKILHLMGHDSSLNRSLPITNIHQEEDDSPTSSGSVYNTHEDGSRVSRYPDAATDDTDPKFFSHSGIGQHSGHQSQSGASEWSLSEDDGGNPILGVAEAQQIGGRSANYLGQRNSKFMERTNPGDMTILDEMLFEDLQRDVQYPVNSKYRRNIADTRVAPPPKSPTGPKGKSKPRPIAVEVPKKPSFYTNARESFAWDSKSSLLSRSISERVL